MSLQDYRNKFPEYNDIPDDALVQGLYKKYGEAENFDHFSEKIGYVPQVTEAVEETPDDWPDDIREGAKKAGEEKILKQGSPIAAKGLARGGLGILESIGTGFQYLGERLPESDFSKKLTEFGKERAATYKAEAEQYPQPKEIAGKNVIDDPQLLGNASWWVSNVSEMVPSLAATLIPGGAGYKIAKGVGAAAKWTPRVAANVARLSAAVFGGAAGGGLEGTQTYQAVLESGGSEPEAARAGELMALSSGLLNAISVGKFLGKAGSGVLGKAKKVGASALVEGLTEGAEEPAEVASKLLSKYIHDEPMPDNIKEMFVESLKSAATVAPIAGFTGGLVGGGMGGGAVAPQKEVAGSEPAPEAAAQAEQDAVQMEQDIESGAIQPNQAVENLVGKQLLKTLKGEEAPVAEEKTGLENLLGKALLQSLQEVEEVTRAEPESATGVENLLGKSLLAKLKQPTPEVAKEEPADTSMQKLIGKGVLTRIKQTPPKLTPQQELGNQIAQVFDNYVKQTQAEEKGARKEPEVPVQQRQVPVPEQTAAPEIKPEKTEKPQEKPKSAVGEIATFDEYIKQKPKLDDMTLDELQKAREHAGRIKKKAPENKNIEGTITKIDDLISQREGEKEASEWIENEKKRITEGRVAPKPRKVAEKAPVESGGLFAEEPSPIKPVKAKPVKQPKKSKLKSVEDVKNLRSAIKKLGRISWGKSFQGERKAVPGGIKRSIFYSKGLPWDTMEKELRDSGWLDPNENLIEAIQNKDRLLEGRRTRDIDDKSYDELTEKDKKLKKELEYEPEAPPKGEYIQMKAEDLPKGKKLTLIEGKTREGWDVYEVTEKDEFGVTLKDGSTINLTPGALVEVRKSDLVGRTDRRLREMDEEYRPIDDKGGIKPKDTFKTTTGRETTPYPKQKSQKYHSQWLINNAVSEAESRGDEWNANNFRNTTLLKGGFLTNADSEGLNLYLFGKEQPDVVPPITKPMTPTLELKGEKPMGKKRAELSAKRRTQSAGRQEGLGLWEKAPKDFKLEGEQAGKKETKAFKKKTGKKIPLSVADEEAALQREIDKVGGLRLDAMGQEGYAPGAGEALVTILGHGFKGKETSIALKITDTEADIRKKISEKQKEFKIDERIPLSVGTQGETRLTAEQVEKDVKTIYDKWVNKPELVVLSYQTELPADFKRELAKQNIKGEIRGAVYKNKIYIIANGMRSADDALKTLVHETAGHWGLQEVLGKDYNATMRGIYKVKQAEIKKAVARHDFDLTKRSERYEAAEEWLAQQAESNPESTWVQQLIAAIRKALRRLNKNLQWSDAEIVSLLQKSREFVQKGGKKKGFKAFDPYLQVGEPADVFYSQMQNVLFQKLQGKGTPQAMKQAIQSFSNKGEFKKEELEWSGVLDWLGKQGGKVTKQQILDYLDENKVVIEEVVKGGQITHVQWESVTDLDVLEFLKNDKVVGQTQTASGHDAFLTETKDGAWRVYLLEYDNNIAGIEGISIRDIMEHRSRAEVERFAAEIHFAKTKEGDTKFSSYTLEGGENYKELLMTMPAKPYENVEDLAQDLFGKTYEELGNQERAKVQSELFNPKTPEYTGSHWDEPNVLTHVRFNERTDADGDRVLFIEEIQSDWHQEGRKKGYKNEAVDKRLHEIKVRLKEIADKTIKENEWTRYQFDHWMHEQKQENHEYNKLQAERRSLRDKSGITPNAPFKKTWPMLAIKRMVRYAAENGFDQISWTSGETQAERYDLSKQVRHILAVRLDDNNFIIRAQPPDAQEIKRSVSASELSDFVGKDLADKIIKDLPEQGNQKLYSGSDLKVGGEGMKSFYDKMLVNEVNKFFNKNAWGKAKVGVGEISTVERGDNKPFEAVTEDGKKIVIRQESSDVWVAIDEDNNYITSASKPYVLLSRLRAKPLEKTVGTKVWTLPITEKMKSKALSEGMPQFQVKAWHGGGIFRKFSDKFMKSGTGGHEFGWGHYVSEEKGVAKYYRDLYAKEHLGENIEIGGKKIRSRDLRDELGDVGSGKDPIGSLNKDPDFAVDALKFHIFSAEGRLEYWRKALKDPSFATKEAQRMIDSFTNDISETKDIINRVKRGEKFSASETAGQYKVKLFKGKSPDEYTFLDWDKPVDKKTIKDIYDKLLEMDRAGGIKNKEKYAWDVEEGMNRIDDYLNVRIPKNVSGETIYRDIGDNLGSKEAASKFLDRAGISGIRYPVGTLSGIKPKFFLKGKKLHEDYNYIGQWAQDKTMSDKKFYSFLKEEIDSLEQRAFLAGDIRMSWPEANKKLADRLKKATRSDFTQEELKKNYVIFDPKNIEILEGPGYHHQFKPNILNKEYIAFSIAPMKDKKGNIDPDKFEKKTGIKFQNTEKNNPKDLYRGVKWLQTAHDIIKNHPTFTPTWEAQMKRVATTHQTSMVDKEKTKPYWEADKESKARINQAFIDGDISGEYYEDDVLKSEYGLSPEEITAYRGMADAMESKMDTLITGFMEDILDGAIGPKVLNAVKTTKTKKDLVSALNDLGFETDGVEKGIHWIHKWTNERKGYVPHKWDSDWVVKVDMSEQDDAVRELFGLDKDAKWLLPVPTKAGKFFPTRMMRLRAAEDAAWDVLKNKFGWSDERIQELDRLGVINIHQTRKLPVELFQGARPEVVKSLAATAVNKAWAKYKKSIPESELENSAGLFESVKQSIEEMYLGKGFGQHLIARQGYKGYRTDLENVFSEYLHGFNAFIAKGQAVTDFSNALKEIHPTKTPKLWSYAKEYIQDMLGESNEAAWFKKIASTYFLAADVSAATLNMTQNWTHAVPLLKAIKPKTGKITAEREIGKAMMDVSKEYLDTRRGDRAIFTGKSKWISEEEKGDMRQALEKGWLDPAFFEEVSGLPEGQIWQSYAKKMHMMMFVMFRGAESLNRTSTFIATLRRAKRSGLDRDEAVKKAADLVLEAHFPYSRGNRPLLVRKTGGIGNIGYTFMTYQIQNMIYLKHRFEDVLTAVHGGDAAAVKTSMKVAGSNLAYILAFGGLNALPFVYLAQKAIDIFDDDEDDWETMVRKHTPKTAGRAITRGIPAALLGNDMSWRVQGTDAIGIPVGFQIGEMLYKRGQAAWKLHGQGEDVDAMFHIMPDMIRNPYRAIVGFREGGTRRGVPPIKYTAGEAATKFLGFTPTREAETLKVGEVTKKKRSVRAEKLASFAERYLIAKRKRDREGIRDLKKDLRTWNRKQRKKKKEGIVIPWKDILRSAKSRKTYRSKGYAEDFPKYMQRFQKETKKSMDLE